MSGLWFSPESRVRSRVPNPDCDPNPDCESRIPTCESRIPTCESRIPNPESRLRIPNPESLFFLGRRRCAGLFLKERLPAQTNLARRVDVDDFHEQLLAFLQLVAHVLHPVVRD